MPVSDEAIDRVGAMLEQLGVAFRAGAGGGLRVRRAVRRPARGNVRTVHRSRPADSLPLGADRREPRRHRGRARRPRRRDGAPGRDSGRHAGRVSRTVERAQTGAAKRDGRTRSAGARSSSPKKSRAAPRRFAYNSARKSTRCARACAPTTPRRGPRGDARRRRSRNRRRYRSAQGRRRQCRRIRHQETLAPSSSRPTRRSPIWRASSSASTTGSRSRAATRNSACASSNAGARPVDALLARRVCAGSRVRPQHLSTGVRQAHGYQQGDWYSQVRQRDDASAARSSLTGPSPPVENITEPLTRP